MRCAKVTHERETVGDKSVFDICPINLVCGTIPTLYTAVVLIVNRTGDHVKVGGGGGPLASNFLHICLDLLDALSSKCKPEFFLIYFLFFSKLPFCLQARKTLSIPQKVRPAKKR